MLFERISLYKNGTVQYYKRYILDLRCMFDFSNMPKDKHYCDFIFFPLNYDITEVNMLLGNIDNSVDGILLKKSVGYLFSSFSNPNLIVTLKFILGSPVVHPGS